MLRKRLTLAFRAADKILCRLCDCLRYIYFFLLRPALQFPGFCDHHEVLNKTVHAVDLPDRGLRPFALTAGHFLHLRVGTDDRQRCFEFMTDVGQKLLLSAAVFDLRLHGFLRQRNHQNGGNAQTDQSHADARVRQAQARVQHLANVQQHEGRRPVRVFRRFVGIPFVPSLFCLQRTNLLCDRRDRFFGEPAALSCKKRGLRSGCVIGEMIKAAALVRRREDLRNGKRVRRFAAVVFIFKYTVIFRDPVQRPVDLPLCNGIGRNVDQRTDKGADEQKRNHRDQNKFSTQFLNLFCVHDAVTSAS